MKNKLFILFILFLTTGSLSANAQLSFAVRGKYFVFGIIEDNYFRTYTYGGELIWNNRHCLGLDANVFRWRNQHDDTDDREMYDEIKRRSYLNVDYKFYIPINETVGLYANAMYKFGGKYMGWYRTYDHPKVDKNNPFYKNIERGTFSEPGIGIGVKVYFGTSNVGLDGSVNITRMLETHRKEIHNEFDVIEYNNNINMDRTRVYIRLNLFYHFGYDYQEKQSRYEKHHATYD